ncbi:MAG: aminotransferase class V-fold PLP-dependent enzyme [Anaerolineae bacterium]|nr:aminotransferase class V-fold PLP-dependent enzyme [Anaerolineae bacterium]
MDQDLLRFREHIPALRQSVFLNTGGVAPLPTPVYRRLSAEFEERHWVGAPLNLRPDSFQEQKDRLRQSLAAFLGVGPGEICFTRGVSDGATIVFNGLPWEEGDEIVTIDEEYPSFVVPALALQQRRGVRIRIVELADDRQAILDRLASTLGPRTRLVAVSHVTTDAGLRLPAPEICQLAHRAGALVYFDGAQAIGQFPVDLAQIGCDFYSLLSYKWLLGPYSAGLLYVREERMGSLEQAWVGARTTSACDLQAGTFELLPDARRYEFGPFAWPLYFALEEAARWLQGIGLARIEATVQEKVSYLRAELGGIPGVTLRSPEDVSLRTGMVAFSLAGATGESVSQALRSRRNIITRATHVRFDGVRVCVAFFTTPEELGCLLECVAGLAAEARRSRDLITDFG